MKIETKINKLQRGSSINATAILQNIYDNQGEDKWAFINSLKPEYSYNQLNALEDVNLVISKERRNYYKIKSNIVTKVCCNPRVCESKSD